MFEYSMEDALKQGAAVIKVIGCGGGGSNAVDSMIKAGLQGMDFVVINTDFQALDMSSASTKIGIGAKTTGGLSAGGIPEMGEKAALEDTEAITNIVRGANMVFITAGMGGGTGTGAAPVVARIAHEEGALTIGVVTKPFDFEGAAKMNLALEGISRLSESVDKLILIPNQNLFKVIDKQTPTADAFKIIQMRIEQILLFAASAVRLANDSLVECMPPEWSPAVVLAKSAMQGGSVKKPSHLDTAANNTYNEALVRRFVKPLCGRLKRYLRKFFFNFAFCGSAENSLSGTGRQTVSGVIGQVLRFCETKVLQNRVLLTEVVQKLKFQSDFLVTRAPSFARRRFAVTGVTV